MSAFTGRANRAWQVLVASYAGLLLLLLVSTLSNPPESITEPLMLWVTGVGYWLLKVVPLLLFIPGLRQRSHKAASWLAYMIMLYFVFAVMDAFTPGSGVFGWLMVLLSLSVFVSSMMFTRWQKRVEAGL